MVNSEDSCYFLLSSLRCFKIDSAYLVYGPLLHDLMMDLAFKKVNNINRKKVIPKF